MSKKQLLNESEIRRFMKLANLEPLAKNVVSEGWHQEEVEEALQAEAAPAGDDMPAPQVDDAMAKSADAGDEAEVEVGGEDSLTPDELKKAEEVLSAMFGKKVSLETEEAGEESEGEEDMDMEMSDEEGEEEDEEGEGEEEKDEMDETLSEDALVETVLARVTARLVAEAAKKGAAKKGDETSAAKKMAKLRAMKKGAKKPAAKESLQLKGDKLEEATSAEGGGPLLKQGKNKFDVYKGHADMKMAKGDKGGSGGHSLETVSAKAEHTITHGGKNLATLGGNKKKV